MNRLYIFCGIPFSGKTFIAKQVACQFNFERIYLDDIKFELFGRDVTDAEIDQSGWDKIYQEIYKRIEIKLKEGKTVVYDTGNFTKHERGLVREIAKSQGIESITVYFNTPIETAKKRLLENRQNHIRFDVTDEDFESGVAEMEPPDENEKHIVYTPDLSIDTWIIENFY